MGEKLEVPVYALKRLVNHSVSNDMTGRYLVLDIDRIRVHMCRITDEFVKLLGINDSDMRPWKPAKEVSFDPAEFGCHESIGFLTRILTDGRLLLF